jgi:hypothetical protein
MPVDHALSVEVKDLLASPQSKERIEQILVENSRLPGPRANLELVDVVAKAAVDRPALEPIFTSWLSVETANNDPRILLPLSAAVALGAIWSAATPAARERIVFLLRHAANDSRWRMREGVAMGLQQIGEVNPAALIAILRAWLPNASLLEQRAMVAALAHEPLLKNVETAAIALEIAGNIALDIQRIDPIERKTEAFKVLKQGLSYALSVITAAMPRGGFLLLERLIDSGDGDLISIARSNLGKSRLTKLDPAEVARLRARIA